MNNIVEIDNKKFIRLIESSKVLENKGYKFHYDESDDIYQIALFKINGEYLCVQNHCPHQNAPEIYNGVLDKGVVICPLHAWSYHLKSGLNTDPRRGLRSLKTFNVLERDNWVFVEYPNIEIPKWRR